MLGAAVITSFCSIAAAEALKIGHLQADDDPVVQNWIYFDCDKQRNNLDCSVFETIVSYGVNPQDRGQAVEQEVKTMLDAYSKERNSSGKQDCAEMNQAAASLSAVDPSKVDASGNVFVSGGKAVSALAIRDLKQSLGALQAVCADPSAGNIRKLVELTVDKKIRTCHFKNYSSRRSFTLNGSSGQYLSNLGPDTPCGRMSIGTLERDQSVSEPLRKGEAFWKFTDRSITTNASGQYLGQLCSNWKDQTRHYSWRNREVPLRCDYVVHDY